VDVPELEPTTENSSNDQSSCSYAPVWERWICRSTPTLKEAVALSCNIEPAALLAPADWGFGDGDDAIDKFNLYSSRLETAQEEAGVAFKVRRGRVRMVEFSGWAIGLSKLSTEWRNLPAAFELFASGAPAPQWPWGDRSTELLDHLVEAAKLWKDYDSSKPATAPVLAEVVEFLTKRKWKGKLISKRMATVMAQLLKADDLRPGPHTNP
jgi:hypothetical protein